LTSTLFDLYTTGVEVKVEIHKNKANFSPILA